MNKGLETAFSSAIEQFKILPSTYEQKLFLYGLFKQATSGDNTNEDPGQSDKAQQEKWRAWKNNFGIPSEDAKTQFITGVENLQLINSQNERRSSLSSNSQKFTEEWTQLLKQVSKISKAPISNSNIGNGQSENRSVVLVVDEVKENTNLESSVKTQSDQKSPTVTQNVTVVSETIAKPLPDGLGTKIENTTQLIIDNATSTVGWIPSFKKHGVSAFRKPGSLVSVRGNGIIHHDMRAVFATLIDLEKKKLMDTQMDTGKRIHFFDKHTFIEHIRFKPVWPTTARDLCNIIHWKTLETGELILVVFSYDTDLCPPQDDYVRAEVIFAGWLIKPIHGGSAVDATFLVQTDLKGNLPKKVVNMISEQQPLQIAALRHHLDENPMREIFNTPIVISNEEFEKIIDLIEQPIEPSAQMTNNNNTSNLNLDTLKTKANQSSIHTSKFQTDIINSNTSKSPWIGSFTFQHIFILFLPIILYYIAEINHHHHRGLYFLAGFLFTLRFVFYLHRQPMSKYILSPETSDGRIVIRFSVDIRKLMRFIDEQKKIFGKEVSINHFVIKAAAIALKDVPLINNKIILGGLHSSPTIDISLVHIHPNNGPIAVKINYADFKTTFDIASELKEKINSIDNDKEPYSQRQKAIINKIPPLLIHPIKKMLIYFACHIGYEIPFLGIPSFPFGSCMIVTNSSSPLSPSPSSDISQHNLNTMVESGASHELSPITLTLGETRMQTLIVDGKQLTKPVLNITCTVDTRTGSFFSTRKFTEKVQLYLNDPSLFTKYDRGNVLDVKIKQPII